MPTKLTTEIISTAIEGYEFQKTRIDTKIAELRAMLSGGPARAAATPEAAPRKRKRFSAASRRKMALSQKARWAKIRRESEPPAPARAEPTKPKRKLSNAGRAAIVAALKKRWAAKKATTSKPKPVASKKVAVKKVAVKKTAATKQILTSSAPAKSAAE